MVRYVWLISVVFALAVGNVRAADVSCGTTPTCDELGYTMTTADCAGKSILVCPFDNTKFFCPQSCADEGYVLEANLVKRCAGLQPTETCSYNSNFKKIDYSGKAWKSYCETWESTVNTSGACYGATVTCSETPNSGSCLKPTPTITYCDSNKYCYKCTGKTLL